jgi:hypothetical protein
MHIVSTVQYIAGGRRAVEAEGWMEYIASGKAEVLYSGRLDGVQCRWERLKYYTGGRLDGVNAGGKG